MVTADLEQVANQYEDLWQDIGSPKGMGAVVTLFGVGSVGAVIAESLQDRIAATLNWQQEPTTSRGLFGSALIKLVVAGLFGAFALYADGMLKVLPVALSLGAGFDGGVDLLEGLDMWRTGTGGAVAAPQQRPMQSRAMQARPSQPRRVQQSRPSGNGGMAMAATNGGQSYSY